jgi:hypothetical protein
MLQGEIKNRRATQCVQQEYSWLLAALAELRLAHSRQRHAPLLSITRHRRATVMATIIGHEMDVPRGGRFRAETAHPTKVRGVEAGTPGMGATRLRGTGWKLRTVPRSLKSALTAADAATFSVTRTDQGGGKRHVAAIHYCLFFAAADGVGRILPHGSDFFSASGIFHLS